MPHTPQNPAITTFRRVKRSVYRTLTRSEQGAVLNPLMAERPSRTKRIRWCASIVGAVTLALIVTLPPTNQLLRSAGADDDTSDARPPANSPGATPFMTTPGPTTASPRPTPSPSPDPDAVLADALREVASSSTGHLSLAVRDTDSRTTAEYAPSAHAFATASIAKVGILAALLLQAQDEGRTLTPTERATAQRMITRSDNAAADTLWSQIGGAPGLARAGTQLGLTETTPGPEGHWGLTTTTAADQLRLLAAVTEPDSPLNARSRTFMADLMGNIVADQSWGVSAAADPDTGFMLKNGWLPRSATGLWVVNSIGVVHHGGHRVLVAVLSDNQPSQKAGIDLVEKAARAATDTKSLPHSPRS